MNTCAYLQEQLSSEDWQKLQQLGINFDPDIVRSLWLDYVNFEKRRATEVPFLLQQLSDYAHPPVFDAALGSGATSLGLRLAGIEDIISNEVDDSLIKLAEHEAQRVGVTLTIISYDWRELSRQYHRYFDAVVCLGNSLTLLHKREDQLRTLCSFRHILREGGTLIIDERNYEEHFLKDPFGRLYRFSGNVVYCGNQAIAAYPIYISDTMVVMEYKRKSDNTKTHLVLYPFKEGELISLLKRAGFGSIASYGDYKRDFDKKEPEFLTHVCK